MQNAFQTLQEKLKIKFKNPNLLKQAFIHRSYLNEVRLNLESNERLEFLGDAILSQVVSVNLFKLRPGDSEGDLTNLRAHIVKTTSLSEAAIKLNLGSYLKLSKGEEISGGRENSQLLANTFEALLGAVYLDQGMMIATKVIQDTLLSLFENELRSGAPRDAKSTLQEIVQRKFKMSPYYKIIKTTGPDHAKEFTVAVYVDNKEMGKGTGMSKQIAEEHAAKEALIMLY